MYYKSLYYAILMIIFGILGYAFLNSGFDTKTKNKVDYKNSSDVMYTVKYLSDDYITSGDKYIANMVNYIDVKYSYDNLLSEYVSGFYRYNVSAYLVAYDKSNIELWKRKHYLVNEKTEVLDQGKTNSIKINDSFRVDFQEYRNEMNEFINSSNIDVEGYLEIRINILEFLNFDSLENEYADSKVITINIPITSSIFEIDVDNLNNKDSYYEFTNKESMNIIFLIIGAFCLSVSISLLILVIRQFKIIYSRQSKYNRELRKILYRYDECIVKINKFYVNKKYNMISVDTLDELMDVYKKTNKMISFKETKRGIESIFIIIDEDNAWIYRFTSDILE